jgi:hypothetical protein
MVKPQSEQERAAALVVGMVAMECSRLEYAVTVAVWFLARTDPRASRILTAGTRFPALCDQVEALLDGDTVAGNDLPWFRAWRHEVDHLREQRNEVVHSAWLMDSHGGPYRALDMMSRKTRSGLRFDVFSDPSEVDPIIAGIKLHRLMLEEHLEEWAQTPHLAVTSEGLVL